MTNHPEQPPNLPASRIDEEIVRIETEAKDLKLRLEILRNQLLPLQRLRRSAYQGVESEPTPRSSPSKDDMDMLPVPLRPKQAIRQLLDEIPGLRTGQVIHHLRGRVQTRAKDFPKAIYAALSQLMTVGDISRDADGRWRLVAHPEGQT